MANEQNAQDRFVAPNAGLDSSKGVALYAQLADLFRYNILSGAWKDGLQLESFEVLGAHYGVARITVRQAVARLVKEGHLTTQRGRGTFVTRQADNMASTVPRVQANAVWPEGLKIDILYKEKVAELPPQFRGVFEVFDSYMEISKLHVVRGVAYGMVRIYVAEEIYKKFPRRAMEKSKVLRLVFAHGGTSAEFMHQQMTVEPSDMVLSKQLNYSVGLPVAKVVRQIYGADRRLSYAGISWYRGDTFEMDITLPREMVEGNSPALIAPSVRA